MEVKYMRTKKSKCLNCGNDITEKQQRNKKHQYKYCSRECFYDAYYGEIAESNKLIARNPLYFKAAEMLKLGFSRTKAAESVGVSERGFAEWLYDYGVSAAILEERICLYCGKSLSGIAKTNSCKYCSSSCQTKAGYRKNHPNCRTLMSHDTAMLKEAMSLYWNGSGGREIAQHFGIPEGTVNCWIHKFGKQQNRIEPLKNQLRLAQNADEWLTALRTHTINNEFQEKQPIKLICGSVQGQSSVNQFATIIYECLKIDPLNGDVFAFCNKGKNIIITFSWDEPIYNISKYIKVNGTFIWPHENLGTVIEITETEFEHLISLQKYNKTIVENT